MREGFECFSDGLRLAETEKSGDDDPSLNGFPASRNHVVLSS